MSVGRVTTTLVTVSSSPERAVTAASPQPTAVISPLVLTTATLSSLDSYVMPSVDAVEGYIISLGVKLSPSGMYVSSE